MSTSTIKIKPVLNIGRNLQKQLEIDGPLLMGGKVYDIPAKAGEVLIKRELAVAVAADSDDTPPARGRKVSLPE